MFGAFLGFLIFTFAFGNFEFVFMGKVESMWRGPLGLLLALGGGAVLGFFVEASADGISWVGWVHRESSERDFVQQTDDGADLVRGGSVFHLGVGEGDLTARCCEGFRREQ